MRMRTPSRREFFTYAAAATLASALPTRAQSKTDQTKNETRVRPLVVDVIGPMAFRWSRSGFDVWMPQLDATTGKAGNEKGNRHESGIITPVMGFALAKGDYNLSGTEGSADNPPPPYPTRNSQIYQTGTSEAPKEYFIHISLPLPFHIVLLHPEPAKIWSKENKPPDHYTNYATGLRLLYPDAGVPTLSTRVIEFEPGPAEKQLDMSITYSPINAGVPADPTNSFTALAKLLNLNLQIEFSFSEVRPDTMYRPCRSPVVQLNVST